MNAGGVVKVAVISSVVSYALATKKVWNVEVAAVDTLHALPSDVQEPTKNDCCKNGDTDSVVHSWSVSVLAKPS